MRKSSLAKSKICPVCGKSFLVAKNKASRYYPPSKQKTCSLECAGRSQYQGNFQCRKLEPISAAYMAGLVDGEGSIFLYKLRNSVRMRVVIGLTKRHILESIYAETGIGSIIARTSKGKNHNVSYIWQLQAKAAESFLHQIMAYLRLKKEQAKIAIKFQERLQNTKLRDEYSWQFEYLSQMKQLNKRGK